MCLGIEVEEGMGEGLEVRGEGGDLMGGYSYELDGFVGVVAEVRLGEGLEEGIGDLETESEKVAAFVP
jgi:hypothetical protein